MTCVIRYAVLAAVGAAAAGCGGSSVAPATPGTLPNAGEMFDKKELPKGAKPALKTDPGE
jgi:hypothetical protein